MLVSRSCQLDHDAARSKDVSLKRSSLSLSLSLHAVCRALVDVAKQALQLRTSSAPRQLTTHASSPPLPLPVPLPLACSACIVAYRTFSSSVRSLRASRNEGTRRQRPLSNL